MRNRRLLLRTTVCHGALFSHALKSTQNHNYTEHSQQHLYFRFGYNNKQRNQILISIGLFGFFLGLGTQYPLVRAGMASKQSEFIHDTRLN